MISTGQLMPCIQSTSDILTLSKVSKTDSLLKFRVPINNRTTKQTTLTYKFKPVQAEEVKKQHNF
jgi:hypothetical protein